MIEKILTEDYRDTFSELFNIGMGKAASSLSEMLNEEVILTVPQFQSMSYRDAMTMFGSEDNVQIDAVEQKFVGDFSGSAYLFFSGESSRELVRRILQDDVAADALGELEQDTLTEVANIILNACFGSIAEVLGCELESEVPLLICGNVNEVLSIDRMQFGEEPVVITLSMTFSLPDQLIKGQVSLLMTTSSVNRLVTELERYIQLYV